MKIGSKVRIIINGLTGIVTSIQDSSNGRQIVNVKLKARPYPQAYWMTSVEEINPEPVKLKQFSAWK